MTEPDGTPYFRILDVEECESLLARNSVGRIAFSRGNRIEIIPLHYTFARGVLCGRTARGTSLEETGDDFHGSRPVAFEVDEVEGLFRWRSVVVHGNLHAAARGDLEWKRNTGDWEEALRSFRTLMPDAFTENDRTRFRNILIRIDAAEVSGREAVPERATP